MLRLVMPACLGGDLQDLMMSQGRFSNAHVQFYSGCIIVALQFLHERLDIAYRDIKPENVLLDRSGWPVLTVSREQASLPTQVASPITPLQ